jgi:hypothetical protein
MWCIWHNRFKQETSCAQTRGTSGKISEPPGSGPDPETFGKIPEPPDSGSKQS